MVNLNRHRVVTLTEYYNIAKTIDKDWLPSKIDNGAKNEELEANNISKLKKLWELPKNPKRAMILENISTQLVFITISLGCMKYMQKGYWSICQFIRKLIHFLIIYFMSILISHHVNTSKKGTEN